jgi:NADH dehydrogenase/NADH:ubiquinone oxidoreductase subunit G
MTKITVDIDGRKFKAGKGEYLLDVCRREGFDIPTLCHHDGLERTGGCRLCLTEVNKKGWDDDWWELVVSCLFPVEDGLKVRTNSRPVQETRAMVAELLLARAPKSKQIKELAAKLGVYRTSFEKKADSDNCIMCQLCVRACEAIGTKAISAHFRGQQKGIGTFYLQASDDCIGCLSCANVCPTDVIEFKETKTTREIWGRRFKLITCPATKAKLVTKEMAAYMVENAELPEDYFNESDPLKRARTAETFKAMIQD